MMMIPSIQIHQQYAKIGMQSQSAALEMQQPKATMELSTQAPKLNIRNNEGELHIDQSKAWDALAVGGHLEAMRSIYSVVRNIVNDSIGRIVQEGNQMMQIHTGRNAIADIAANRTIDFVEFNFPGPPSIDNVDITYTARPPEYEAIRGEVKIHTRPNPPEIEFHRGKLDIYMQQYNQVEITPPVLDMKL